MSLPVLSFEETEEVSEELLCELSSDGSAGSLLVSDDAVLSGRDSVPESGFDSVLVTGFDTVELVGLEAVLVAGLEAVLEAGLEDILLLLSVSSITGVY